MTRREAYVRTGVWFAAVVAWMVAIWSLHSPEAFVATVLTGLLALAWDLLLGPIRRESERKP